MHVITVIAATALLTIGTAANPVRPAPAPVPGLLRRATCGSAGYDAAAYVCLENQHLCPVTASKACVFPNGGFACYAPEKYCCVGGALQQAGSAACSSQPPPLPPPTPPPPPPTPTPTPGGDRRIIEVVNNCGETVWPAVYGDPKPDGIPFNGGWKQEPGTTKVLSLPQTWSAGRIWARTGCRTENGQFHCETGDCGSTGEGCNGRTGQGNALLAEWTFVADGDFYDISAVDAYNVGMTIVAIGGAALNPNDHYARCDVISCAFDINSCPANFQVRNAQGRVVSCINNQDNGQPQQRFMKARCPDAYSWPYDDPTSTFRCRKPNYRLILCPTA
ncbi:hypothetical protein HDU96_001630 [Phlyctochytrium bullatum]|nr:hypothetical protein HDU96_001630 [Phlyctochytrium bullatum]